MYQVLLFKFRRHLCKGLLLIICERSSLDLRNKLSFGLFLVYLGSLYLLIDQSLFVIIPTQLHFSR